ncbi:hypothetical protein BC828DRAFT_406442 [Blastocladiella britannica]|nr:hypothetical protein BC828DRAFT_406442 [Blastocladiella britannica]
MQTVQLSPEQKRERRIRALHRPQFADTTSPTHSARSSAGSSRNAEGSASAKRAKDPRIQPIYELDPILEPSVGPPASDSSEITFMQQLNAFRRGQLNSRGTPRPSTPRKTSRAQTPEVAAEEANMETIGIMDMCHELVEPFDSLEWLSVEDRVAFRSAFLAEFSLRFSEDQKQVTRTIRTPASLASLFQNLSALRDNALLRTHDILIGSAMSSSLTPRTSTDMSLRRFKQYLSQHMRPVHLAYLASQGIVIRRKALPEAPPVDPPLLEAAEIREYIYKHMLGHAKVAALVPPEVPPEVRILHEKRKLRAEVMRELKVQQQLHARLGDADAVQRGDMRVGLDAMGRPTLAPQKMHRLGGPALGGGTTTKGATASSVRPGSGESVYSSPDRRILPGFASVSSRTFTPQPPGSPKMLAATAGSRQGTGVAGSSPTRGSAAATSTAAGETDGQLKEALTEDPLLTVSVLRQCVRDYVPLPLAPQARYLTRGATSSPTNLGTLEKGSEERDLQGIVASAEQELEKHRKDSERVTGATGALPNQLMLQGSDTRRPMSAVISPTTFLRLTGLGPPRMVMDEPLSHLLSDVQSLVAWVEDDDLSPAVTVNNHDLDNQLTRAQEVEELFDEIMASVTGGQLNIQVSPISAKQFPAIPGDSLSASQIPGIDTTQFLSKASLVSSSVSGPVETRTVAHRIQLLTRTAPHEVHVKADAFRRSRKAAMAAVPSSKDIAGGVSRYNFGGYVPQTTVKVRRARLTIESYREFVGKFRNDFLAGGGTDRPGSGGGNGDGDTSSYTGSDGSDGATDSESDVFSDMDPNSVAGYNDGEWPVRTLLVMSPVNAPAVVEDGASASPAAPGGPEGGGRGRRRHRRRRTNSYPGGVPQRERNASAASDTSVGTIASARSVSIYAPPAAKASSALGNVAEQSEPGTPGTPGSPEPSLSPLLLLQRGRVNSPSPMSPAMSAPSPGTAAPPSTTSPLSPLAAAHSPLATEASSVAQLNPDLDPSALARRFDQIGAALAMSPEDRLHVAVMYGREPLETQFRAVRAWELVATQILAREQMLMDWVQWEYEHTQPHRFWERRVSVVVFRAESEAAIHDHEDDRLVEARERSGWMQRLEMAAARVRKAIEVLTLVPLRTKGIPVLVRYRGREYLQKMADGDAIALLRTMSPRKQQQPGR